MNKAKTYQTVTIRHRKPVSPSPFRSALFCFSMGFSLLLDAAWLPVRNALISLYWRWAIWWADSFIGPRNRTKRATHWCALAGLCYSLAFALVVHLTIRAAIELLP